MHLITVQFRLPQLIAELQLRPSPAVARIISYVGEQSEQQVFYAIASAEPLELITEAVATGKILFFMHDL